MKTLFYLFRNKRGFIGFVLITLLVVAFFSAWFFLGGREKLFPGNDPGAQLREATNEELSFQDETGCGLVPASDVRDSILGKFNLRWQPNGIIFVNLGITDIGGDIKIGKSVYGKRKFGNTFFFINPFDKLQYLVDVIVNKDETGCNINSESIDLRQDPECTLVEGRNIGEGTGMALGVGNIGLDLNLNCPENMYIKNLYRKDTIKVNNIYANEYSALCCSETLEKS